MHIFFIFFFWLFIDIHYILFILISIFGRVREITLFISLIESWNSSCVIYIIFFVNKTIIYILIILLLFNLYLFGYLEIFIKISIYIGTCSRKKHYYLYLFHS